MFNSELKLNNLSGFETSFGSILWASNSRRYADSADNFSQVIE